MALQYKIYDDGMLKQVDVINTATSTTIGSHSYHPQEMIAEVSGSELIVLNEYTRAVKFKAAFDQFVDVDGNVWGASLQVAATNLNTFLQELSIRLGDLKDIDEDSGGLTVNLDNYALTTYVDSEIQSAISDLTTYSDAEDADLQSQIDTLTSLVSALDTRVTDLETAMDLRPQVLFQGSPFTFTETQTTFTAPSAGQMSFTTTSTGKVEIILESVNVTVPSAGATSVAKSWLYVSSTNPSFFNYRYDVASDPDYAEPLEKFEDLVADGSIVLMSSLERNFANIVGIYGEGADITKSITIPLNLTPDTSYTLWLYDTAVTINSGLTAYFKVNNGIRVMEVVDP